MVKEEIVLISDIHMPDADFPQHHRQLLYEFLELYVKPRAKELYLLGDVFEFSQKTIMREVFEQNADILLKLSEVAHSGTKIIYLLGNHDFDFAQVRGYDIVLPNLEIKVPRRQKVVLRERVPRTKRGKPRPRQLVPTLSSGYEAELNGKRAYLAHGHEYNHYFAGNPRRHAYLIGLGGYLEEIFGREADDKTRDILLSVWERATSTFFSNEDTPGSLRREVRGREDLLAARDILRFQVEDGNDQIMVERTDPLDYVVFGHTHTQRLEAVRDNVKEGTGDPIGTYINTGCWVAPNEGSDFTVVDAKGLIRNFKWADMPKEFV